MKQKKAVPKPVAKSAAPSVTIDSDGRIVANNTAMAKILGVGVQQLLQYRTDGMPTLAKSKYDVAECVRWQVSRGKDKTSLTQEELKLKIRSREIDIQEREGKLIEHETVVQTVSTMVIVFKQTMQTLPRKLATRLVGQTANEIEAIIAADVRTALQELSDGLRVAADDQREQQQVAA